MPAELGPPSDPEEGAGAFALLATAVVRRMIRDGRLAQSRSSEQIASLRALVDDYEALLSSTGIGDVIPVKFSISPARAFL